MKEILPHLGELDDRHLGSITLPSSELDDAGVPWQTSTYKVARGGGGTLGREIARYNIETIDFGVPVLSIHTPYSVSDKSDVYNLYRGVIAFHMHRK